jgi:hypothetical protein
MVHKEKLEELEIGVLAVAVELVLWDLTDRLPRVELVEMAAQEHITILLEAAVLTMVVAVAAVIIIVVELSIMPNLEQEAMVVVELQDLTAQTIRAAVAVEIV